MASYFFIILGTVLVNNVVFVRILGLCPFMGVSKKLETAIGMGAATTFVLTMGTGASFIIDHWLLAPFGLEYLRTLAFIVTIAAIVQLTELVIQKTSPLLHQVLGIYLPLITTNCCVLGVTILAVQDYTKVYEAQGFGMAYAEALICAAGAGVGFLVAMLLFCGVRQRVERSNPPESFKGLPITLVSAAITAMSFMGFGGLVENIIAALM